VGDFVKLGGGVLGTSFGRFRTGTLLRRGNYPSTSLQLVPLPISRWGG
jgi:hypothetical protein